MIINYSSRNLFLGIKNRNHPLTKHLRQWGHPFKDSCRIVRDDIDIFCTKIFEHNQLNVVKNIKMLAEDCIRRSRNKELYHGLHKLITNLKKYDPFFEKDVSIELFSLLAYLSQSNYVACHELLVHQILDYKLIDIIEKYKDNPDFLPLYRQKLVDSYDSAHEQFITSQQISIKTFDLSDQKKSILSKAFISCFENVNKKIKPISNKLPRIIVVVVVIILAKSCFRKIIAHE